MSEKDEDRADNIRGNIRYERIFTWPDGTDHKQVQEYDFNFYVSHTSIEGNFSIVEDKDHSLVSVDLKGNNLMDLAKKLYRQYLEETQK